MLIQHIAAFSHGQTGGNPAGVVLCATLPDAALMQATAKAVGYSETVFAAPDGPAWRARYFAPAIEVPFCGHATIALAAALALAHGDGAYTLNLNQATITLTAARVGDLVQAALQSPPATSAPADPALTAAALSLLGYTPADLDPRLPPALASAGATHLILTLNTRAALAAMRYHQPAGEALMTQACLTTILLAWPETPTLFHTRNPFAAGGIYEDPATGAAAAALAGFLRDRAWPMPAASPSSRAMTWANPPASPPKSRKSRAPASASPAPPGSWSRRSHKKSP